MVMLLDDDIMRQLRATFRVEAAEHIQAMNRVLLALEKNPEGEERAEFLKDIFREAHSLKGAAGAADFGEVETTAHRLESVFGAAKAGEIDLTPDLCDVLYEAIDAVSVIIEAALEERSHELDLLDLHTRLDAAEEGRVVRGGERTERGEEREERGEQEAGGSESPLAAEPTSKRVLCEPEAGGVEAHRSGSEPQSVPRPQTARRASRITSGTGETIRVATSKLDSLMTQAGELLVARLKIDQRLQEVDEIGHSVEEWNREWLRIRATYSNLLHDDRYEEMWPLLGFLDTNQQMLKTLATRVGELWRGFSRDALHLSRVTTDLGEDVMKVRMLPVSTVFDAFPRMVRDLSRERGKEIDLQIKGAETELDRKVLEEIKDPLLHVLRNAVDHGIESPEERVKAGKPRTGAITLRAFQKGNNIVIEVSDDGAGINIGKVKRAALKAGVIGPDDVETMSDDEAMRLIFFSGVSTSSIVTDVSGRGVGMDVVRKNVEALHGHVDIDSRPGQGTNTTLVLPLTLATTQELLVQVGDQIYGIPISAVERIRRIHMQDISTVEGKEAIVVDDDPISLVYLADVLALSRQGEEARLDQKMPVVILGAGKRRIAFLVDGVVGQQESVVKSLGKQLSRVRNVTGATTLGTGQVIMTLNPSDLIKSAGGMAGKTTVVARINQTRAKEIQRPTILVVDDSLTTRNLEKNILEMAGYEVMVATDGVEALSILQSDGCDLVVSDVLMPRMDGFEFTTAVRGNPGLKEIPVILVTSLEKRDDRERGIEVGADAYIVKSTFDQANLLQTIEQLI
ncbi:MAG: hybrid sensor histidine kinase/response regulator [Chloroflexota bacterium]|nr:hybrid sensor histidine kinase/response regulator [Chloroflexota bacterium]